MSFLDATGLGTFWGKLKNYFLKKSDTETPVTGLTDILTPVNLISNSDFAMQNPGMPITYTMPLNTGTTAYTGFAIDVYSPTKYICLYNLGGIAEITKISRGIHIKFTVTERVSDPEDPGLENWIWVNMTFTGLDSSKTYTLAASSDNISSNINDFVCYNSGGTSVRYYLSRPAGHLGQSVCIVNPAASNFQIRIRVCGSWAVGDIVEFDIKDICLYEGSFKNPPAMRSLNAQQNPSGLMKSDCGNKQIIWKKKQVSGGNHWFKISNMASSAQHVFFGFIPSATAATSPMNGNLFCEVYEIDFSYIYISNADKNNKRSWCMYIDPKVVHVPYANISDLCIKKFRYRKTSNGTICLEVYIENPNEYGTMYISGDYFLMNGSSALTNTYLTNAFGVLGDSDVNSDNTTVNPDVVPDITRMKIFKNT